VYIGYGGSFAMPGEPFGLAVISGNTATQGGGVSGGFTMTGGTVSGNTATSNGGGVFANSGTFTMNGGTISGNTADFGGGVCVTNTSIFTMTGGIISGNTSSTMGGGGVYAYNNPTFTKTGGTIYGDTDNIAGNGNATDNTATSTTNSGTNGHAVLYHKGDYPNDTYYYRNETLTGADNISSTDLQTNWTKRP
jgi:hypothetical protein